MSYKKQAAASREQKKRAYAEGGVVARDPDAEPYEGRDSQRGRMLPGYSSGSRGALMQAMEESQKSQMRKDPNANRGRGPRRGWPE